MELHDCEYKYLIEDMKEDLTEIKTDVKSLLAFKWKIVGMITFISATMSLAATMIWRLL